MWIAEPFDTRALLRTTLEAKELTQNVPSSVYEQREDDEPDDKHLDQAQEFEESDDKVDCRIWSHSCFPFGVAVKPPLPKYLSVCFFHYGEHAGK
jgi:hypothetical protein